MWKRNHSLPEQIERGLDMNENLFRPQFDTLKLSDKLWLMQTLATRYNLTFKELYAFSRWRQSCTTGLFEKGGREFVFVPGDTVILGWEGFIQGMDKANQEELADIFAEIEYEGTAEEFLRQGMTPVRQMTIGPMFVGRKLEEIGWESVPMNDPRITAHPEWLENLQRWAGQDSQSFEIHETVRFERNADSWRAWLCHPMTYPEFQRSLLWELAASLPTPDEWAYLCGGGCRTLFPWGDGLDYKMKLHHFEREEEQGKRHHDTPRIRLQNEQGNPTPICEIKPVGQSKLELMASKIFERVWGDQREIVLQTCKMLDACYKPDADRRADLMKAKDDSIQLLQQQLDDLVVVRARGEIEQDKFLQRTIEIQQQMEALRQSKAQIASEDYNPGRLDMEAIEAALCEAVEMHDGLVSEDFIDLFVSQVTPLSDSRFAWCLDFSPQPTVAFLNLAGQRKYTTCSMDSKLHFGPFADEEGHTIPFPGSLRR